MDLNPSLWVVDDDPDDVLFIRTAFSTSQPALALHVVTDSTTLIPLLDDCCELPDLILLDLNMPRKNGFDILAELRGFPKFNQLPIVVLTTSSAPYDRDRCLALGANDFLTKPYQPQQFSQMARALCVQWNLQAQTNSLLV